MASLVSRSTRYVCCSCRSKQPALPVICNSISRYDQLSTKHQIPQRRAASSRATISRPTKIPKLPTQAQLQSNPPTSTATQPKTIRPHSDHDSQRTVSRSEIVSESSISPEDVRGSLRDIQIQINTICASNHLPEEAQVLEVMDKAYQFANLLVFGQTTTPDEEVVNTEDDDENKSDTIFSELDEPSSAHRQPAKSSSSSAAVDALPLSYRERSANILTEALYNLLKDPKIHISEPILATYVRIICQLGNPEFLPEIFFLYANKPQPIKGSSPLQYRNPSPGSPKNAVPQELSDVALDTAILQRDLALAVAVIDTTVNTRAFRLSKFIKKASLPLAFVGSTPIAAYAAADWVANWQNSLDPNMAKAVTLMGSAAYIGTLSTIAFVAVTTWNDHHERVRWTEGTPLRYRWMREEERLYFDRIAMAWGFQRKRRRGEEMGELWEELREECGVRGFVLDKSDLLPGMQ